MKNFVFLGDSITDAERLWIPEYNGLGNGYVQLLAEKLSNNFNVINKGHDTFTLPFLLRNLECDCLSFFPAAVSILIDRKSTRLNSSHSGESRMPSSA